MSTRRWKSVWITGASSGIGLELASLMIGDADNIAVSARSQDKLDALAASSSNIHSYPLDVTDEPAVHATFQRIEQAQGGIDLAVLNAGWWQAMSVKAFDSDIIRKGIEINYMGVIYALDALLPLMISRGQGHIAIVASIAGYRGLPGAAAYGPTKAALINLAETLNNELSSKGITVSVVNPGFVDTPMTEVNDFPMPHLMPAEKAAQKLLAGLKRKHYEIVFPKIFVWQVKLLRLVPNWLFFWLVRHLVGGLK